jgi:AcrR family transcriptional regulator
MAIETPEPRIRLSKAERRQQLLDTATSVIETEGADALTLAHVAARAGVSKPVAYDHFETRTGLLLALLAQADSVYEGVARQQIANAPQTLAAYAGIVAEAYIACALEAGAAATALTAALEATADAQSDALASRNTHVAQFAEAFAPVLADGGKDLRLIFIALVAAANALCNELTADRIEKAVAITTLTDMLVSTLTPYTA